VTSRGTIEYYMHLLSGVLTDMHAISTVVWPPWFTKCATESQCKTVIRTSEVVLILPTELHLLNENCSCDFNFVILHL
jgi:hypothetical protein